jgi:hypothetical protein
VVRASRQYRLERSRTRDRGDAPDFLGLVAGERAAPKADVLVRYRDLRSGHSFIARPPRERALHAFYHPNAYAPAPQAA